MRHEAKLAFLSGIDAIAVGDVLGVCLVSALAELVLLPDIEPMGSHTAVFATLQNKQGYEGEVFVRVVCFGGGA